MKDKKNIKQIKSLDNQQTAKKPSFSFGEWACAIVIILTFAYCL
jgi:hypothetical protein